MMHHFYCGGFDRWGYWWDLDEVKPETFLDELKEHVEHSLICFVSVCAGGPGFRWEWEDEPNACSDT